MSKRSKIAELTEKDADKKITPVRWEKFLRYLVSGFTVAEARDQANIPHAAYRVCLLLDEDKREQRDQAMHEYRRSIWTDEIVEDILTNIAAGGLAGATIAEHAPVEIDNPNQSFYSLMRSDDVLRDKYDLARQTQMWGMADEILQISDDETNDLIDDGKGGMRSNPSAVRRSEVKTKNRQWLMERLFSKQFGAKIQNEHKVQVIDHATTLEEARRRKATSASKHKEKLVKNIMPLITQTIESSDPGE